MINKKIAALCVLALLAPTGNVLAAETDTDHAQMFEETLSTCVSCHGEDGMSSQFPAYPILAGQYASYLEQALIGYRDGLRKNPFMTGMAAGLSDKLIADLAAYFSSQKGPLETAPRP